LAIEASSLYSLLTSLRIRVEGARSDDTWFIRVKLLGTENGLVAFKDVLEKMVEQISSSRRRDQVRVTVDVRFTNSQIQVLGHRVSLQFVSICVKTPHLSSRSSECEPLISEVLASSILSIFEAERLHFPRSAAYLQSFRVVILPYCL
jgi:hypothetical protein